MKLFFAPVVAALIAFPALAHSYKQKAIQIGHAWCMPTDSSEARAFFPLLNASKMEDRLLSISSNAAKSVTYVDRFGSESQVLRLPPNTPIALRKGGAHILFKGLARTLKQGDKLPLTLTFENAGRITIEVWVEPAPYAKQHAK